MISSLAAAELGKRASSASAAIAQDPIEWILGSMIRFGVVLVVGGLLAWIVGYYLGNAATAASTNLASEIASVGAVFGNVAPTEAGVSSTVQSWLTGVSESERYLAAGGTVQVMVETGPPQGDTPFVTGAVTGYAVTVSILDASGAPVTDGNGTRWNAIGLQYVEDPAPLGYARYVGPTTDLPDGTPYTVTVSATGPSKVAASGTYVNPYMQSAGVGAVVSISPPGIYLPAYADPAVPMTWIPVATGTAQGSSAATSAIVANPVAQAIGNAVGDLAGTVVAVSDVPKAIVVGLVALPSIAYDAAVSSLGGPLASILSEGGRIAIVVGVFLLAGAWFARLLLPRARAEWTRFGSTLSRALYSAETPSPAFVGQMADDGRGAPTHPDAEGGVEMPPEDELAPTSPGVTTDEEETGHPGASTEELENELGVPYSDAKMQMREAMRAAKA